MTDTTALIRAKKAGSTGITEQLANQMYNNQGAHYMAIVEFKVDERHEKADGTRKVDLVITQIEPATDSMLEEYLRELTRVGYLNRQQTDGQLAIDQSLGQERTVADVLASGGRYKPHPFLPVDASQDNPICDVCGGIEASAVHSTQEVLDEPDDEGDEEETAAILEDPDAMAAIEEAEAEADPWAYDAPEGQAATIPDPFTAPATT